MRSLSDFPRKDRTFIVIGSVLVVLGVLGILNAYFAMSWWFVLLNGFSRMLHRLLPLVLVALGAYIIWASRTGKLHNMLQGSDKGAFSRSRTDCRILGVCGGFAQRNNLDSTVVRIIVLLLFIAFPLLITVIYLLLGVVMQPE